MTKLIGGKYPETYPNRGQTERLNDIDWEFAPPLRNGLKINYTFSLSDPPILTEDENHNRLSQAEIDQQIEEYKKRGEWGPWLVVAIDAKGTAIDQRHIGNYAYVGLFDKVDALKISAAVEVLQDSIDEAVEKHKNKKGVA